MARPENPIDYTVPEVGMLAKYLRDLRSQSGMTFRDLAGITPTSSESALKRAVKGGSRPPKQVVVIELVEVTDGDLGHALKLLAGAEKAAAEARREARRSTVLPKPGLACTRAELGQAMRDAYNAAARPTLDEMVDRAGLALPRSTAHLIVKARNVPRDVRTYLAFLHGIGVQEAELHPWIKAWVRVVGWGAGVLEQKVLGRPHTRFESVFDQWVRGLLRSPSLMARLHPGAIADRPDVLVELVGRRFVNGFEELDIAA
ncbi:hypothetical protein OG978_47400 (plasmid) [Streptomyces sp. NBC_01591]|uniref:hypothetical protein n=1 Tax=Streptomyces sp. NBC_01591 TaxID=2975888 RepID=UPI002DD89D1A|nr:hypothetical protein [Streptomyces sp. NBC_01591]WSD66005.1 hypothetical protein OG978_00020 [Streptomyces sp. NBC_01591]WSD73114.1 hypothetical protein OG978_40805 [Streptomyces sp. NBC_01591]WSD73613.1 hypothetical protein OG978_40840 [Streptomyces sp. NBC_01591]WSD74600.1 hypothetical protein OG978_47400 [Streptomyces sp. NBC_01591]